MKLRERTSYRKCIISSREDKNGYKTESVKDINFIRRFFIETRNTTSKKASTDYYAKAGSRERRAHTVTSRIETRRLADFTLLYLKRKAFSFAQQPGLHGVVVDVSLNHKEILGCSTFLGTSPYQLITTTTRLAASISFAKDPRVYPRWSVDIVVSLERTLRLIIKDPFLRNYLTALESQKLSLFEKTIRNVSCWPDKRITFLHPPDFYWRGGERGFDLRCLYLQKSFLKRVTMTSKSLRSFQIFM